METQERLPERLALPQVTLCAVTSVNVVATLRAMETCLAQIDFGRCILLTDFDEIETSLPIEIFKIPPVGSSREYSDFILFELVKYISTQFCMIVQWDGHVIDASRWKSDFLQYDYIGASWPQFKDEMNVGNGGFSIRSRRLLQACQSPEFRYAKAEDLAIGRENRNWLSAQGIKIAPQCLADRFSAERAGLIDDTFGYHGVWHMPKVLGLDSFWEVYTHLDNRGTIRHDIGKIVWQVLRGPRGLLRATRLLVDYLFRLKY